MAHINQGLSYNERQFYIVFMIDHRMLKIHQECNVDEDICGDWKGRSLSYTSQIMRCRAPEMTEALIYFIKK